MEEVNLDYDKLYQDAYREVFDARFNEVMKYFLDQTNEETTERKLRYLDKTVYDEYKALLLKNDRSTDSHLERLIEAFEHRNDYKNNKIKNFIEKELIKVNLRELDNAQLDISKNKEKNIIIYLAKYTALKSLSLNIARVGHFTKATDDEILKLIEFGDDNKITIEELEEGTTQELDKIDNSTAKQVLVMHYIFNELGLSGEPRLESAKRRLIRFMTSKNDDAIKERLRSPLENRTVADLRIIEKLFDDLKLHSIVDKIYEDKQRLDLKEQK